MMTAMASGSPIILDGLREAMKRLEHRAEVAASIRCESSSLQDAALRTRPRWAAGTAMLVATGHQATFRHPGILVKDFVAAAIAKRLGGAAFRLLVDQDVHAIGPLRVPSRDAAGRWRAYAIPCNEPLRDCPTGRRPPITLSIDRLPPTVPAEWSDRIATIDRALRAAADEPSAALQVARAFDALAGSVEALPAPHPATELLATPIGRIILEAIAEDPQRCAACFNEALRIDPRAARHLEIEADRVKVPLWSIGWCRPRERMHLDPRAASSERLAILREAATAEPSRLAPRGLLMTGLVRLVADLFIHGRGGWRYDRVTERWFADWLGATLAPMAMATADLRLPLGETTASSDSLRRRWHDPLARDSSGPSETKSRLLQAIEAAPRGSASRRAAFRAMHRDLEIRREQRGTPPPPLRGDATAAVASSREWAFPLHAPNAIDALRAEAERVVRDAIDAMPGGC